MARTPSVSPPPRSKKGAKYILNGSKIFVTNGPVADVLLVFAMTDKSKGASGVSAFLVEKDTPGLDLSHKIEKMGMRTSPMAEVFFTDCEVPEENLLGKEGAGGWLFTRSMTWERGCILASAVGPCSDCSRPVFVMPTSVSRAASRSANSSRSQAKIVDMKMRIESSRHMLYQCAWAAGHRKAVYLEAAMAKLQISESWVKCCEDAIQIHGGYGYMVEYEIERELRDAIGSKLYSGTSEIQRNIIASLLGL